MRPTDLLGFATASKRKLHERRRNRGEEKHKNHHNKVRAAVIVAAVGKERTELRDARRNRRGHRTTSCGLGEM